METRRAQLLDAADALPRSVVAGLLSASGLAAAACTSLGTLYMLQALPRVYVLKMLVLGVGISQPATPLAWVISPCLLMHGQWHNLYMLKAGLAPWCCSSCLRVCTSSTMALLIPGVGMLVAFLVQGTLHWWVDAPELAWLLMGAIGLLCMTPEQMQPLFMLILLGTILGMAVSAITFGKENVGLQLMAAIVLLRMGTLYGHSGWGWISTAVAKNIKKGRVEWLGPYNVATPWAYAPDVAHTMERIASQSDVMERWTSLHFAGHQRTGQDWLQAMQNSCHALGWLPSNAQLKPSKILWPLWQPVALVSSSIRALCMMEYIWRTPHRLDNQHLRALIGAEPQTDWQLSVRQTLERLEHDDQLHGGIIRTMQGY